MRTILAVACASFVGGAAGGFFAFYALRSGEAPAPEAPLASVAPRVPSPSPEEPLRDSVASPPSSPSSDRFEGLYARGVDLFARRQYREAQKVFGEILAADPDNVEARHALARVLAELP